MAGVSRRFCRGGAENPPPRSRAGCVFKPLREAVAVGGELPGKVAFAKETGEGAHRRVEAGRGGGDGVVAENHRSAVDRLLYSQPAVDLGRFLRAAGGAADGQQLGDAELGVDVLAQAVEVPVVAEEMGEAAPLRLSQTAMRLSLTRARYFRCRRVRHL